ncbi:endonuclease/exonuclease/phosphatase family protein [Streptomyces sp. IBSBF 2390]|uniref:endonuclease/exonuclease/phosphatase family protein n=1 Tax=Streptomyces sp. IBSBF 2390 TaxID=2903533 RepID=UPI002FDBE7E9
MASHPTSETNRLRKSIKSLGSDGFTDNDLDTKWITISGSVRGTCGLCLSLGEDKSFLIPLARYKVDITALQEMRWKGCDIYSDKRRKADIYYSCAEEQGSYGVGIVVRGNLRKSVMAWIPVNERICVVRMKGTFYNTCIVCAYAPTNDADGMFKDTFHDQLDATLDQCPKHDAKVILGDFNAKIGRERYQGIKGTQSKHNTSTDNAERLINFAASRQLIVSSTCFPHKNIHKGTWRSPDKRTVNQIDHVLVDSRHASNILDVRSYRYAEDFSDHYPVIAKVRARISNAKRDKQKEERGCNIEAWRSVEVASAYASEVSRKLQSIQANLPIEEHWKQCAGALTSAATEVLGPKQRRPRKEWFDEQCRLALQKKHEARQRWNNAKKTRGAQSIYEEYRVARRLAVNLCRAKKRHFEDSEMRKVELLSGSSDTRKFYQHIKRQKEGYVPPTIFCNDASGNLLENVRPNVAHRSLPPLAPVEDLEEAAPPSAAEIKAAIRKLKRNKSPGSDGIHAELLKCAGDDT